MQVGAAPIYPCADAKAAQKRTDEGFRKTRTMLFATVMKEQRNIVSIGTDEQTDPAVTAPVAEERTEVETDWNAEPEAAAPKARGWVAPVMVAVAIVAWTAFYAYAQRDAAAGGDAGRWAEMIVAWSMPVLLILAGWAVAMRFSRAEASRFAESAALLRDEARSLEDRLVRVNGELSIAREFLTYQARDLESLGRVATDRIGESAHRLETLIGENGARIETLHETSRKALTNMENLRGQIPVLTNATRDLTNSIGQAGSTADDQVARLTSGFARLGEAGEASTLKIDAMHDRAGTVLIEFERRLAQLGEETTERFAALDRESAALRERIGAQQGEGIDALRSQCRALEEALDAARARIDESRQHGLDGLREQLGAIDTGAQDVGRQWHARLGEIGAGADALFAKIDATGQEALNATGARVRALSAEISRLHDDLARRGETMDAQLAERLVQAEDASHAMTERLGERLGDLDGEIEQRRQRYEAASGDLARHAEHISTQLAEYGERMDDAASRGRAAEETIATGLAALSRQLGDSREALNGTDAAVGALREQSARLLDLIEASARHSRDSLPQALTEAEERLETMDRSVTSVRDMVNEASNDGQRLSQAIAATREQTRSAMAEIDALHDTMQARGADHAEQLIELRDMVKRTRADAEAMTATAEAALDGAVRTLAEANRSAIAEIESHSAKAVAALAADVGTRTGAAVEDALNRTGGKTVAAFDATLAQATEAARTAARQLEERLRGIDELTAHLEHRIAEARARAEEDSDEGFARRVAQITDALHSTAIDIDKVLSAEVSETAWQAYLRGERGIFTRRAVRLLDNGEARSVHDHYEADAEFRENVNRYIRDFETMLRNLLSTRDGNALSITLLSSDMGKLYVALAQAIERIRK